MHFDLKYLFILCFQIIFYIINVNLRYSKFNNCIRFHLDGFEWQISNFFNWLLFAGFLGDYDVKHTPESVLDVVLFIIIQIVYLLMTQ